MYSTFYFPAYDYSCLSIVVVAHIEAYLLPSQSTIALEPTRPECMITHIYDRALQPWADKGYLTKDCAKDGGSSGQVRNTLRAIVAGHVLDALIHTTSFMRHSVPTNVSK